MILSPNRPTKLFSFIVNRVIGKDQEHSYISIQLDPQNNELVLKNNIKVLSGVFISYRWAIESTSTLDEGFFEISAKGFFNILDKLDNKKPVSLVFKNEQMIDISTSANTDQMTLFDSSELPQQSNNSAGVKYSAQMIIDKNNVIVYEHSEDVYLCGFKVITKQLCHWLKLVQNLIKMPAVGNNNNIAFKYEQHNGGGSVILMSMSGVSCCSLPMSVEIVQSIKNGSSEQSAFMSTQHLTLLIDLLSAEQDESMSDTIEIFFTPNHIAVKQESWQCLFQQCDSHWAPQNVSKLVQSITIPDFQEFSIRNMLDVLPKLNVAKEEQKARLTFKFSQSNEITLSVDQDQITSSTQVYLPHLAHIVNQEASLNLLALQQVLSAFKTVQLVEWAFDITKGRLIIRDEQSQRYVVFSLIVQTMRN
ncbi:hypothetical protein [Shewanella gaetbuli]